MLASSLKEHKGPCWENAGDVDTFKGGFRVSGVRTTRLTAGHVARGPMGGCTSVRSCRKLTSASRAAAARRVQAFKKSTRETTGMRCICVHLSPRASSRSRLRDRDFRAWSSS